MKNPLSFEEFADWCDKQPAEAPYDYLDARNCACIQYASFLGITNPYDVLMAYSLFWRKADLIAASRGRTFGALAARLRKASKAEATQP